MVLVCDNCHSENDTHLYRIYSEELKCLCRKCYQNWRDGGSLWAILNDESYVWADKGSLKINETYLTKEEIEKIYEDVKILLLADECKLIKKWSNDPKPADIASWIDKQFLYDNHVKYLISQIVQSIIKL